MKIKKILGLSVMLFFTFFSSVTTKAQDIAEIEENTIDEEDLRYMASIIYAEAGNQCEAGQQAVGIVVMNRVASDLFADTVYDVIYQKGQFTPVTDGNLKKALKLYDKEELPQSCIDAAIYALNNNTTVHYNNKDYEMSDYYYFSRYVKNAKITIESHMFK
jgi:spore germination cell wall hydrolase CwlJ-like protein